MLRICSQNAASKSATKPSANGPCGLVRRLRGTFAHAGLAHMDSGIWTRCSSQLAESECIYGELSMLKARSLTVWSSPAENDEHRHVANPAAEIFEKIKRCGVGPVNVVEDEH